MWKIYYSDGSTFDDSQGGAVEAPGLGIVVISYTLSTGDRSLLYGWDYYFFNSEYIDWQGADLFGLLDNLTNDRKNVLRAVKAGRTIPLERFNEILHSAIVDDYIPTTGDQKRVTPRTSSNIHGS